MSNLILLSEFDRGYYSKQKDDNNQIINILKKEKVKCHLWFSDVNELKSFLAIHRPISLDGHLVEDHDKLHVIKWVDYMTLTKEEMGIK